MSISVHHPHICIGVSSCLLGEQVRYDGGHRHNDTITTILSRYFTLVPFCPEVAVGMGIPRPPIHLVKTNHGIRARGVENPQQDMTAVLAEYGRKIALETSTLCGYIFKARSPSCGITDVPLFDEHNKLIGQGQGLFAAQIRLHHPELPVMDETALTEEELRERFIQAVLHYADRDK